jgi:hypothetical protein
MTPEIRCNTCDEPLPADANYCLRCGSPQKSGLRPSYSRSDLQTLRRSLLVYPVVVAIVFLAILLATAYRTNWEPIDNPMWWVALLGVFGLALVPQILFRFLWREKDNTRH